MALHRRRFIGRLAAALGIPGVGASFALPQVAPAPGATEAGQAPKGHPEERPASRGAIRPGTISIIAAPIPASATERRITLWSSLGSGPTSARHAGFSEIMFCKSTTYAAHAAIRTTSSTVGGVSTDIRLVAFIGGMLLPSRTRD
jgi:hypothetical protein